MKTFPALAGLLLCLLMPLSQAFAINKTDKIIDKHIKGLAAGKGDPKALPRHESIKLLSPGQVTSFYGRLKDAMDGWSITDGPSWGTDMGSIQMMFALSIWKNYYSKPPGFIYSLKDTEGVMRSIKSLQSIIALAPKNVSSDSGTRVRIKKLQVLEKEWKPHLSSLEKIYLNAARSYWESPSFRKHSKAWKRRKIASMPKGGFTPKFGDKPLTKEEWKFYIEAKALYIHNVKNAEDHRKFFVARRHIKATLIDDPQLTRKVKEPADFKGKFITEEEGKLLILRSLKETIKDMK